MIKTYKTVIMANGQFPTKPLPLASLHAAEYLIATDGAVDALHTHGLRPNAIVGDSDSLPDKYKTIYAKRVYISSEQETNDLTKAVNFAKKKGCDELLILGATGLREDHSIANISLLTEYAPHFKRVEMLSDYALFTPALQTATYTSTPGQQVSIFSIDPETTITTEGLKWPVKNHRFNNWWQGTLNEATGPRFTIALSEGARVIVCRDLLTNP